MVARLDGAAIPYMLSGSTAVGVYATPRMTRDLDIVVALEPQDADRFVRLFADDFYCDADAVRRSAAARSIVNMIHLERVVKVDVVVRKDTPYRRLEFERRRRASIDGTEIWVVSPEDLILSKLAWAKDSRSEIQLGDAGTLLRSVAGLDRAYMEQWARELSVTTLLHEIQS